ncbi:MAG TPA: hypothetical protein VFP39_08895, partial [Gemmatimonadales bacterium]|nr:hypothetical protein [Gemmatimonadales bacterium]
MVPPLWRGALVVVIGVGVSTCRVGELFTAPPGGELIAGGTLSRSGALGSKAIVMGKIPVSNTGRGVLTWTAKALGTSTWFSIQNLSGESKTDSVRLLMNPAGLDTGTYTDSVSISSDVGGTATVLVNWTIVQCQPRGIQAAG